MCESTTAEGMSSIEVLQQNGGHESLESDYSIIADHHLVNGGVTGNGHFDLHLALTSATPDLSLEELQSRLADVVEDNVSLREQLRKNNNTMEQQLQSISSWHSQLTTKMSKQELDLKEAQDKIKELEKEKKNLLDKIKEGEEKKNRAIRDNISPLSDEEVDFEIINRKELKKMVDESKLKEAEDKISNMIEVIEDQSKEIEDLKKKLFENEASQTIYKESSEDHGASRSEELIQKLEKKVKDLEQSLAVESAQLEEEKACHSETKKMFAMVQTNYDRVTKLLQIQSRDERDKTADDMEREMDTKMYLEQIDQLTAKLLDAEQKLQDKVEMVKELISKLNGYEEDTETIPILKAQAEVYKMDLETASLARDAAKEEVNRLTQQLHEVGSASLCDSCHGSVMEGASKGKGKKKPSIFKKLELKHKDDLYCCPICLKGFTSLRAAENHVNECIDQSEQLH